MPDTYPTARRILRAILPPPQTPKHREDRLKAAATVFQNVAIGIVGVGLITPFFAGVGVFQPHRAGLALCAAVVLEIVSLLFLLYIPYNDTKEG